MSHTDAVRFLDAVETDEAFAQQLEALRDTPDQALDAVRARGFDVDPDEVREAFVERYGADLTEEQLAAIAGGANPISTENWILVGALTAAYAAAHVAAAF